MGWGGDWVPEVTNVVAISAGFYHSLALKANGTVVAWDDNTHGQASVPPGLSNVVAISAGGYHSLALKSDASVVSWGDNWAGEVTVPSGLTNVVAIAAGYLHSLALTGDGSPTITVQPFRQTVHAGSSVTLTIMVASASPVQIQWRCNGTNLAGATNSSLLITNAQICDAGAFSVVVSNTFGTVSSTPAMLVIEAPRLSMNRLPNSPGLVIEWPGDAAGYQLETSDRLPGTNWTVAGGAVLTNGMHRVVLESPKEHNTFVRLERD